MHYRAIMVAFMALSALLCAGVYAFPRPDEIKAVRSELGLDANRLKALSEAEHTQGPGQSLPVLRYSVINLSGYDSQKEVDEWLQTPGLDAVIHRSSMGTDGSDNAYTRRSATANHANYHWGAYHFIRPNGSGREQATWFVRTLLNSPDHPKTVLLVVDAEYKSGSNSPHPTLAQIVDCVQRVHELTGKYPGIYTGQDYLSEQFRRARYDPKTQDVFDNTWLWVARYSAKPTSLIFPQVSPPPWDRWTLWQVSDKERPTPMLEGMKAEVNVFKGERTDLEEFWSRNAWDYQLKGSLD